MYDYITYIKLTQSCNIIVLIKNYPVNPCPEPNFLAKKKSTALVPESKKERAPAPFDTLIYNLTIIYVRLYYLYKVNMIL